MFSKVKVLGHPLHPMVVAYPIALYTLSLVAYVIYAIGGITFWLQVGTLAGVGGALMAAVTIVRPCSIAVAAMRVSISPIRPAPCGGRMLRRSSAYRSGTEYVSLCGVT